MKQHEKDKITKLLPELLKVTTYNVLMIAELKSRNVFSLADECDLESIPNTLERVNKFFEILKTRIGGYSHLIDCLRITKQSKALEILGESWDAVQQMSFSDNYFGFPDSPEYIQMSESVKRLVEQETREIKKRRLAPSIQERILSFNVRAPSKLFTGRVKELDSLKEALTSRDTTAVISQNSNISGLGGIGKTELAKKFIHSIDFTVNDPMFNTIVWINAESETTANKDIRTLATDKLRINTMNANGGEEEIETVLDKIYRQLESRKTLLVFDNVESPALVKKYRPTELQTSGHVSILITSQETCWDFGHEICLSGMEEEDAIEFVRKGLGMYDDCTLEERKTILPLVTRLERFPLAIDQAIAFINDRRRTRQDYGPSDYLTDLEARKRFFLTKHASGTQSLYKRTIYDIVTMTLDKIKFDECFGDAAVNLAKMMAFMEPENIPDTMFQQRFDEFTIDGALCLLQRYSIVSYAQSKKDCPLQIFIHRLVQDVIRMMLAANDEEESILQQCLLLFESYETSDCINSFPVDHVISCWKFAAKHTTLVKTYAALPCEITKALVRTSRFHYGYDFATSQLEFLEANLGYAQDPVALLNLEMWVSQFLHMQQKFKECKTFATNSLNKAKKCLGTSHSTTLCIQGALAQAMAHLSEFDEALKLLKKVYNEWKLKSNGEETCQSIMMLHSMGILHLKQSKNETAAQLLQRVIDESKKIGYEDYSVVSTAKSYLAIIEMPSVNPSVALDGIRQDIDDGEQHPGEIVTGLFANKMALGLGLMTLGQFSEALQLHRSVLPQLCNVFGNENSMALSVNMNIVLCMIELGQREDLLSRAVEVYDGYKRNHGEGFLYTVLAYATVGVALYCLECPEKALFIILNCLNSPSFENAGINQQLSILELYAALCLEKLGRFKEALSYLEKVVAKESGGTANSSESNYWELKASAAYERVKLHCQE